MLWYIRQVLYKEPFGGPLPWWYPGVGCFGFLPGLFGIFSRGPSFLIGPTMLVMGLMFVSWGMSDPLLSERRFAILTLRAGGPVFQSATVAPAVAALLPQGLRF